jgi:hypothetical protein
MLVQGAAMAPGVISVVNPRKTCLKQAHKSGQGLGRFLLYKYPHRIRNIINVKRENVS